MKKNILYSMLFAVAAFMLTSCGDDESAGKSRITYYPTIELQGGNPYLVAKGSTWKEPGFTSFMGGEDVSSLVTITGTVNTAESGDYTLNYATAKNDDGFSSSTSRRVIVVDADDPIEGLYWVDKKSYRLSGGKEGEYPNSFPVIIFSNGDGTYSVDDILGGWYYYGRSYGIDYAMGANIVDIADDGTVILEDAYVPGWDETCDGYTINYDAEKATFTVNVTFSGMDFVQTWVKQQVEK